MENNLLGYLNNETLENLEKEEKKYLQISKEITRDIKCNTLSIVNLIEHLRCLLLNNLYTRREMGVLILCEVLKGLETNMINTEYIDVLSSYFAEKLKDHHQVATSALQGVLTLISFPNCSSKSVIQLITSIFNHIMCQQQQQPDRYKIYQIYEMVLTQHGHVVDTMQNEFVYGVISSIDGERDPKNLVYLFKWIQLFLKKVKLAHLTEEMFDVLACYFPVDFKAPPKDTNKITREDLAQGLCECLTCIPDFGPHAIPLALEKLDSALKIAKEDALEILRKGCQNYMVETYKQFSLEILNQLQKDIFTVDDEGLRENCKETLKAIINKLESDHDFKQSISDLTSSLKSNLAPGLKVFHRTTEFLLAIAEATAISSLVVVQIAGGFLRDSYESTTDSADKSQQLRAYINFIKSAMNNNSKSILHDIEEIQKAPLLCLDALLEGDEILKTEGLKGFSEIGGYISEDVRGILFKHIKENIVVTQSDATRKSALFLCFAKMSEQYPVEVDNSVLYKNKIQSCEELNIYIEYLSHSLVNVQYFEDYLINTFIGYAVSDVDCSKVIFDHLRYFLEQNTRFIGVLIEKQFIPTLTNFLSNIDNPEVNWLLNIKHVLTVILRDQSTEVQKQIYENETIKVYRNELMFNAVLIGIIVGLKKSVFIDSDKIDFLLNNVLNSSDYFIKDASLQCLASILNKINQDLLEGYLNKIQQCCNVITGDDKILLMSWVTKSLVTRNHSAGWNWTNELVNLLNDNIDCSSGFRLIVRDEQNPLSLQNDSIIMPLYKQKFFVYATNKLCEVNNIDKAPYFKTVGYLIENAPRQAVLGQFKKVTRLVFLCLEKSTEAEVLEIILLRLTEFMSSKESVIENCLEDVLLRILDLTTFESSMRVRIAALRGLKEISRNYPIYKLVPLQQRVIRKLGVCIDDKKRIVRREAVDCRTLWYLLDADL
ncbi:MMS19 nucleotide excision repair protein [Rhynchophorus ferrugineus]|uniref:MMS19 nucleotide excision repair protein n=1 Tax=Rhynchophorus ferrugineus TaxID=354439 RepID=UPI003FCCE799